MSKNRIQYSRAEPQTGSQTGSPPGSQTVSRDAPEGAEHRPTPSHEGVPASEYAAGLPVPPVPDEQERQRLAKLFKALASPHRLSVVLHLARDGEVSVGDLGEKLDIVPSTVSHHLKELTRSELVTMRRDGQRILCSLNSDNAERLAAFFRLLNSL